MMESLRLPTAEGRAYYTLKRDSFMNLAEIANAAQEGYTIMTDESIANLQTLFSKIEPTAVRAVKAEIEADRLTADANAYREQHRGKF